MKNKQQPYDEWLSELQKLTNAANSDKGLRIQEVQEKLKISKAKAYEILLKGVNSGVVKVGKRMIKRMDGHTQAVPVYSYAK